MGVTRNRTDFKSKILLPKILRSGLLHQLTLGLTQQSLHTSLAYEVVRTKLFVQNCSYEESYRKT